MTRSACLHAIYDLAAQDERVVFIGSDLSPNTMLDFKQDFPDRFFMEGVCEQAIIGMAAGLAREGYIPYVNTIAPFIVRRAYEQVAMDVCLPNLPVRFIANGGGLVYAPLGPTHCCIEDMAIMRALPNMAVVNCSDSEEMKEFMPQTLDWSGPMYIRLGKDSDPVVEKRKDIHEPDKSKNMDIVVVANGCMTDIAQKACDLLPSYTYTVINHKWVKPFGLTAHERPELYVSIEEGIIDGLGGALRQYLEGRNIQIPVLRLGFPDAFPPHYGEREDLLETYGLTPEGIAARIKEAYEKLK